MPTSPYLPLLGCERCGQVAHDYETRNFYGRHQFWKLRRHKVLGEKYLGPNVHTMVFCLACGEERVWG